MIITENHTTDSHDVEHHSTGTVILFLSFAVLAACICKLFLSQVLKNKFPVPFTVVVLILGFIIGIIISHIDSIDNNFLEGERQLKDIDPHLLFYIFLPLLIFDAAFNSHFHIIQKQIFSGILLAGLGVFIGAPIIALCAIYIFPYDWSWLEGLMFGSILSTTDPVAIVALLHESGASKSLAALIELESLLNDGSTFVIFLIFKDIIVSGSNSAKKIIVDIVKFTLGGSAFGFACGIIAVIIFNMINNDLEVEIIATFGLAYLLFYIADVELTVSGVLAVAVVGLYMAKHKYCISSHVQLPITSTWRIMIYFIKILIFIITGIILAEFLVGTQTHITGRDFGFSIVLYIFLHLARLLAVACLYPFMHWSGIYFSWKEYLVLTWSGLRSSMAVILALIIKSESHIDEITRNRFLFHICMIVLFTLTINGTSSKFVVRLLGLNQGTPESETILLQALEHMRIQTSNQLNKMKQEKQFSDVDWNILNEYLPEKLVQEMDASRKTSIHRRLSAIPNTTGPRNSSVVQPQSFPNNIHEINSSSDNPVTHEDFLLPVFDFQPEHTKRYENMRNEMSIRFLTALLVDYEKQWYLGMIRRRTLYILIKSVEKARHQCSIKIHWDSIIEQCRLSFLLQTFLQFDSIDWIKKQLNKFLFDHIFLMIELVLAFHSTRDRMNNIRIQFPELAHIDEQVWKELSQEISSYQQIAAYTLLDLQQSYPICWRIQMTKRCASMLLKYESIALIELYETGILGETEYAHILELIEKKLFDLEFTHFKMPQNESKTIEHGFHFLSLFQLISENDKSRWEIIMKSKQKWFQPGKIILQQGQIVNTAYLIGRGIIRCEIDNQPIYYRSGNIIGIDCLFSKKLTAHGTYSVVGGVLEAYCIDIELLNQLLNDEELTPSIYREIALHILSNHYAENMPLNRSQIKLLLQKRARFYHKQLNLSISIKVNERLLLLNGYITFSSGTRENNTYDSIKFHIFNQSTDIVLNKSSVMYVWTYDDETYCLHNQNVTTHFPVQTFGSISNDLIYPGYSGEIRKPSVHQQAKPSLRHISKFDNIQEVPSEAEITLQQSF